MEPGTLVTWASIETISWGSAVWRVDHTYFNFNNDLMAVLDHQRRVQRDIYPVRLLRALRSEEVETL